MKTGFYNYESDEGYDFLENLKVNNKTIDALYYLHGDCHSFAFAINYDYDIESDVLVHAFNTFKYKNKEYYVDIRGITDNINDIINEFDYSEKLVNPWSCDSKKAEKILKQLGLKFQLKDEPVQIINIYSNYYKINEGDV